nr:HTH-type transcriptional regulator GltC [Candidatus Pantoea persica]
MNLLTPPANCTFEPDDWLRLARCWQRLCDVGPAPMKAVLLDEQLVIYRINQQIVVAKDVCPYRGVPLTLGFHDEHGIICPYHGLRFGEDGRCNRIPSSPDQPVPAKLNLISFPVELVWVCLAPDVDDPAELPAMPHWVDDGFQQITCPPFDVAGLAGRQVEGFLDVAHFAWVHSKTFADASNQQVPPYNPVETPNGFAVDY